MQLYEFEAKKLLKGAGIKIPEGEVVCSEEEAVEAAENLGGEMMIKVQTTSRGRAEVGGVKVASSSEEVEEIAEEMLSGEYLGEEVDRLLIEEKIPIKKEVYCGVITNRNLQSPELILSTEGGTGIEEIASEHPEKIGREAIDIRKSFYPAHARKVAKRAGFEGPPLRGVGTIASRLYSDVYREYDAQVAEINPIAITEEGMVAIDVNMSIDDEATFRVDFESKSLEKQNERQKMARAGGRIPYLEVNPEGKIAMMSGGAGLATTIFDLINESSDDHYLSNFMDIGGPGWQDDIKTGFKICMSFDKKEGVLVHNIGGMYNAREYAEIFCEVLRKHEPDVPIVLNLAGTKEEDARDYLREEVPKLREKGIDLEWSTFFTEDGEATVMGGVGNVENPIRRIFEKIGADYKRNPPSWLPAHPEWEETTYKKIVEALEKRPEEKYQKLAELHKEMI